MYAVTPLLRRHLVQRTAQTSTTLQAMKIKKEREKRSPLLMVLKACGHPR
jgi:hypothetical protein